MAKRAKTLEEKKKALAKEQAEVAEAEGIAVDLMGVIEGRAGVAGNGGGAFLQAKQRARVKGIQASFFVIVLCRSACVGT